MIGTTFICTKQINHCAFILDQPYVVVGLDCSRNEYKLQGVFRDGSGVIEEVRMIYVNSILHYIVAHNSMVDAGVMTPKDMFTYRMTGKLPT